MPAVSDVYIRLLFGTLRDFFAQRAKLYLEDPNGEKRW